MESLAAIYRAATRPATARRRTAAAADRVAGASAITPTEFADAFARHARVLWVVASAHAPRELAEDVLQDAAVVGLARLRDLREPGAFRPWMARIVSLVARNAGRRAARGERPDAAAAASALARDGAAHPSPEALSGGFHPDALAFDDDVARALEALSADARATLLLNVVAGLSYAEIGAALDLPVGTVGSHVSRARASLRERLAPTKVRP